ncbi:MAG: trypsin-like peptidase domain-containing protein [Acidobacteria bacterium]|nr:trypsin-like peptidase domain-containing protein [Acidobacteriota bacterium]
MHQRVVLRHLSGSKTGRVDKFGVEGRHELTIGRTVNCSVRFDKPGDDLVAPMHAKVLIEGSGTVLCSVMDLNTRTGTFVNQQRIRAAVRLVPGDVIQLGAGGPEIQFDLEPRPPGGRPVRAVSEAPLPFTAPVGELDRPALVTRKAVWMFSIALLAVLVAVLAWWGARRSPGSAPSGAGAMSAGAVAAANQESLVYLEAGWKLVDGESGRPFYQVYQSNAMKDSTGNIVPIIRDGGAFLPVFVQLPGETTFEPLLAATDAKGAYRAIGGAQAGSGFVVGEDGSILTDRNIVAAWQTSYRFPPSAQAGLLYQLDRKLRSTGRRVILFGEYPAWRPLAARAILASAFDPESGSLSVRAPGAREVEGRNEYLNAAFARERPRFPARLLRVSEHGDAALAKIEASRVLRKVDLLDTFDTIQAGGSVIVMGFPATSFGGSAAAAAGKAFVPDLTAQAIPAPTISVARLARILRESSNSAPAAGGSPGGIYGLTFSSTGNLSSGGPVFDSQGRAIAIHSSARPVEGQGVDSSAVPIREGMRLMQAAPK